MQYCGLERKVTAASKCGLCPYNHRYDVELFQRIESLIGKKLPAFPTQEEEVMMLVERVSEAQRFAKIVSHPVFIVSFLCICQV